MQIEIHNTQEQIASLKETNLIANELLSDKLILLVESAINLSIHEALNKALIKYSPGTKERDVLDSDSNIYDLQVIDIKKYCENKEQVLTYQFFLGCVLQDRRIHVEFIVTVRNFSESQRDIKPQIESFVYYPDANNPFDAGIIIAPLATKTLYYYTSAQFAVDDFIHEHLSVSRLGAVNDPNEWVPYMVEGNGQHLSFVKAKDFIENILGSWYGLISLTRRMDNEPMWGLYAKNYTGAVLEVEVDESKIHSIEYDNNRVDCSVGDASPLINRISRRKSKGWSFEEEERYIFFLHPNECEITGGRLFKPIEVLRPLSKCAIKLKAIYCGPFMPKEQIDLLRYAHLEKTLKAAQQDRAFLVKIYQTHLDDRTFAIKCNKNVDIIAM